MDELLRKELPGFLNTGWAYDDPINILADFPLDAINTFPPNVPYTPWQLLEHIRFCQQEILEQIEAEVMPQYTFPDDFWPAPDTMATPEMWQQTVNQFFADRARFVEFSQTGDLASPCRNNLSVSVLHALLNIASHNHHHFGEFSILRQIMGTWPQDRG